MSPNRAPVAEEIASPFATVQPSRFQFSMSSLLILMVVISASSACLLWASRLPLVTNEIHAWLGTTPATNSDGTDRGTQLVFLLFCYSAPLMVAGALHSIILIVRLIQPWVSRPTTDNEEDFVFSSDSTESDAK